MAEFSANQPLHQLNPLGRFSDRAEDYARYRPIYPPEAIAAVLAGWDNLAAVTVADVGAGTGISARLLADCGVRVIALEPNGAMRQAAEPHTWVEWRNATAEQTGLAAQSVDLVTCFQAFHWFEPRAALAEFHRILKPGGRLAIIWNERDRCDACTQGYSELVKQASKSHPAESRMQAIAPLLDCEHFTAVRRQVFACRQRLDQAGLIGRAMSVSYLPSEGELHDRLIEGLVNLYNQHRDSSGWVVLTYATTVYLAEPVTVG